LRILRDASFSMAFDHTRQETGEIEWITALEERRLWEQFVRAVQAAGGVPGEATGY
jgi:hypothetical protein